MDPSCHQRNAQALASKLPKVFTFDPAPPLTTVLAVHRKMRVDGVAYLAHAADGCDYVLKLPSATRPCLLFREALGELLGAEFGLPMANWAALSLGSPTVDYTGSLAARLPGSGYLLGFGSRIPKQSGTIYEYLPESWIRGTEVARQMVRMEVLDAWLMNGAPRQYVAYRSKGGELQIRFIANGFILSRNGGARKNPYQSAIRLGVDPEHVSSMFNQISGVLRITLERLIRIIPDCWMTRCDVEDALAALEASQLELLRLRKNWLRTGIPHQALRGSLMNPVSAGRSTPRSWNRCAGGF